MVRFGNDEVDGLDLEKVYGETRPEHRSSPKLGSAEITRGTTGRERMQSIAIGVKREQYVELVDLACGSGRSMSCLVRQAIDEFLERERGKL